MFANKPQSERNSTSQESNMLHRTKFTIRTFHTDAFGHVNNSRYLEILEEARWRYAEDIGLTQLIRPAGLGFIIIDLSLRFRRPVCEGDEITVGTRLITLGSASGEVAQTIHRSDETSDAVRGMFHFILVDRDTGKSVPIEGEIRDLLSGVLDKA